MRRDKVFADFSKHPLPKMEIYGGDKLETLLNLNEKLIKPKYSGTKFIFTTLDSLSAALHIRSIAELANEDIAIVNFANRRQHGGVGDNAWFGSQEECLARTSNMTHPENFKHIDENFNKIRSLEGYEDSADRPHHIPYFGTVLALDVIFIIDKYDAPNPQNFAKFHTIWSAAVDNRDDKEEAFFLKENFGANAEIARYQIMRHKLKAIFDSALAHKITNIVHGAFGGGCFNNDNHIVARITQELLVNEYKDCFKSVTFAITEQSKLDIYQKVFNSN